jgi:hypothetical protein
MASAAEKMLRRSTTPGRNERERERDASTTCANAYIKKIRTYIRGCAIMGERRAAQRERERERERN